MHLCPLWAVFFLSQKFFRHPFAQVPHHSDEFEVEVSDPSTGERLFSQVAPAPETGLFLVTYQPGSTLRSLSVSVLYHEAHIQGSPFTPLVVRSEGTALVHQKYSYFNSLL